MKQIVITGCSRGCGLAWVGYFAARDWTVHGCARSGGAVDDLSRKFGDPHTFATVDVSDAEAVQNWASSVLLRGAPDLLVNNAAIMNDTAPLWEIAAEEFDRVVDINIKGVANVIRAFLPAMIDRGSGMVVNLSSGWGRSTSPEVAPYCATKWAIEGLSQALSQEVPAGIGVVALSPGIIDTEMLRQCWADGASAYPSPDEWIKTAGPFLEKLTPADNGKSLSVG